MAGLVLAGASNAAAQTQTSAAGPVTARVPVTMEELNLPRQEGAILLSLEDAVELAVRRNLGLVIERYVRTQAELGIQQALGIYDTQLNATASALDRTSPTANVFEASSATQEQLNVELLQAIPTGGQFTFGFENSRSDRGTANAFNPAYDSGLTFSLAQPLLRDFGTVAFERQLLIAQNQNAGSTQEFARQVIATLQQVTDAYWNLVEAREQLNVARQSLGLAQELHERNRIQVEVGTLAPLELVQSEANIATNEEEIIRTQTLVGDAEDELRRLLNFPQGELWQAEIRPATDPASENTPTDLEAAIRQALDTRPEIRAQRLQVDLARAELDYFQNQTLPTLDLALSYGLSGSNALPLLDANGQPVLDQNGRPRSTAGNYGDTFEQLTGFDFDGWTASLTFGFPLQNRTARAARTIAELDVEQAETVLEQLEQSVITEVRQAARRVDSAAKQIDAARASVRFQERSLDAERKRYENGMSSSFEITRIQQDLTAARSREVSAIIAYRTAVTQLQRVTGQLLTTYGLAIDDPEAEVQRWRFFGRNF